ncbi:MAG: GPW/gp25 family protein [Oscillospiraceae bacterium]
MSPYLIDMHYPLEIGDNGEAALNSLDDEIAQSLVLLLSTRKGERVMRPNYGCDLEQFAFESINYTLLSRIEREIKTAIAQYEPRVCDVTVSMDLGNEHEVTPETLLITISYQIAENAHEQSMSFVLGEKM